MSQKHSSKSKSSVGVNLGESKEKLTSEGKKIITAAKDAKLGRIEGNVLKETRELYKASSEYFSNTLAEFMYFRTYSRWVDEQGRRETWIETVDRYMDFMRENLKKKLTEEEYGEIREYILTQKAVPSMRLLQFSGEPARRSNVCAYNCSFVAPSKISDFGEIMYILMSGTGVGFTVESENVHRLPQIKKQTGQVLDTFIIPDSREGWADALILGMKAWFSGKDVKFDFSAIRPFGSRLKTTGGRASGPDPLKEVLEFTREKVLSKQGKRLDTIDVHDIVCMIGQVVVAGGVRRSALISLSDLDDPSMRDAKLGQFYLTQPYRSMSNNSAVYTEKPSVEKFLDEWLSLVNSKSGERGIFNRGSLSTALPKRRVKLLKDRIHYLGTNPCAEILLQDKQFCNLSEVIARPDDTVETLLKKVRIASILGTYQATLTKFPYLSKEWKKNCEEERLLGVSISGQWDCPTVRDAEVLEQMKKEAIKVNKEYAKRFNINSSSCITCVKPSGNTSQTLNTSSGLHPRYSQYYIRRVRIASHDPLFQLLKDQGVPYSPEVGQTEENATTWVLDFPIKSPDGSVYADDLTAIEQLEYWKMLKTKYTEHNPSCTVYVGDDEWIKVANWVYENWDIIGGISFLPRTNHVYQLAPYEKIDKEKYKELAEKMEQIDFSLLTGYEMEDSTEAKKELACAGGQCEI